MALFDRFGSRRKANLKKTLNIPGGQNKVVTGTGQNIQQDSNLLSNKAKEQMTAKPVKGARKTKQGLLGRSTLRPEPAQVRDPTKLTSNEMFKLGARGKQDIVTSRPSGASSSGKFGTSIGTESEITLPSGKKQRLLTLRGTKPPVGRNQDTALSVAEQDAIEGISPEQRANVTESSQAAMRGAKGARRRSGGGINFDIADFKGIENIFSSAGNLAAYFSSPAFQAQQMKARGAQARRRGITAQTKATNERIKALSTALDSIPETDENVDVRNALTTQIKDLITNGSQQDDPVLQFAEQARNAGFSKEEILSISNRLFGKGNT